MIPSWIRDRRGLAAIEFAIVAPVLLMFLGGITDFGLIRTGKSQMANGVAQGVAYAMAQGSTTTAANVISMVNTGAVRAGLANPVTTVVSGPACYCVSGRPAALVLSSSPAAPYACTGTCPVGAMAPGVYMTVTASFVYQPLMPLFSLLTASPTISETIRVRLK